MFDLSKYQGVTPFFLNREANRIAQSNPVLAAELRMLAYQKPKSKRKVSGKKQSTPPSVYALNRKANRYAQVQPQLAQQLRFQAAYA